MAFKKMHKKINVNRIKELYGQIYY
jgi:hypothetical protein